MVSSYYENKWAYLTDIIDEIFSHATGSKLFVIGGQSTPSCNVFDSLSENLQIKI